MNIKERLNLFIDYKSLNNNSFEEICGLGHNASIKNKCGMQSAKIEKIISKFPELNVDWLVTGRGEMLYHEIESSGSRVAEQDGGYESSTMYIASLRKQIEHLEYIVELQKEIIGKKEEGNKKVAV